MNEYIRCNLCGDDAYEVMYPSTIDDAALVETVELACTNTGHGRHQQIVKCRRCGLIYSNPRDPFSLLLKFYGEVKDEPYNSIAYCRKKAFQRCLLHLEKFKNGRRLLDVGCYTGIFMELARNNGWEAYGIEPSIWAANEGRIKDLKIKNLSAEDMGKIEGQFDAITMWDAIEHLSDPARVLSLCFDKLNKEGIMAIATMRSEGLFYAICGRHWPWFMRMHLYYFTFETLRKLLEKTGFRVVLVYPYVHYINLSYLFYKLKIKSEIFLKNFFLQRFIFPVQLGDFMEVYAVKD